MGKKPSDFYCMIKNFLPFYYKDNALRKKANIYIQWLTLSKCFKKYLLNKYTHSHVFTEMRLFYCFSPTQCTIDIPFQLQ